MSIYTKNQILYFYGKLKVDNNNNNIINKIKNVFEQKLVQNILSLIVK